MLHIVFRDKENTGIKINLQTFFLHKKQLFLTLCWGKNIWQILPLGTQSIAESLLGV